MGDVLDFNEFKKAKLNAETNKSSLLRPSKTSKISGPKIEGAKNRIERIQASLEKINRLMAELKETGDKHDVYDDPR